MSPDIQDNAGTTTPTADAPPAAPASTNIKAAPKPVVVVENSTDATRGQGLRSRVEKRVEELKTAHAKMHAGDHGYDDIERALAEVKTLTTGDLDNIPSVVGTQLNKWLEAGKHLAEPAPH